MAEMASEKSSSSIATLTSNEERALMRRVDWHLVPTLILLYLMAFLDRVNIGNALTLGLPQELHLKSYQPNIALAIFYVPYIIFEIPSNLVLRKFKPHVWLSFTMFSFGLVIMCHGFVQSYSGLIAARFFLGVAEAGVFPGCFYLISMWYKREEAQRRFTTFFQSVTLAGAFGGLLASAIEKLDGKGSYSGWRWIFILEGLLTIVIALAAFFVIPDFPEESKWITEEERVFLLRRIREEHESEVVTPQRGLAVDFSAFFSKPSSYLAALMYFGGLVPGYSIAIFLPTIIKGFHYGPIATQLHAVPPFAAAWVFSMTTSFLSDRVKHRFAFMLCSVLIGLAGVGILLRVHDNVRVQYAGTFLVTIGTFSALPIQVCWYIMNLRGHGERAIGSAWMISFGNIGGIVAVFLFAAKDAPEYHTGYSVVAFALSLMGAAGLAYLIELRILNKRIERKGERYLL